MTTIPDLGTTLPPEAEMVQYFGPLGSASNETTVNFAGHQVTINKVLAGALQQAGDAITKAGLAGEIHDVGGFRTSVGASGAPIPYSMHQFGAALDINEGSQNWHTMSMDPKIVQIMSQYGFYWGGNWSGVSADFGHFQFQGGNVPAQTASLTSFNPLNPGSWIQSLFSPFGGTINTVFQRLGLILLGGILILVGIWMLGGKDVAEIALPATKSKIKSRSRENKYLEGTGASELGGARKERGTFAREIGEGKRAPVGRGKKTGTVAAPSKAGESGRARARRMASPVSTEGPDTSDIPF